jgi:hypothetical protein
VGFFGNLRLSKPARRFVLEALYGIQTRGSLGLSEIPRALGEDIALIKTETRLSRQAARPGLHERLTDYVIAQGTPRIGQDSLLVLDPSAVTKPYARRIEHLARVRDGSAKRLSNGYWLCQVVGVDCGGQEITALVNHLWSQGAPGFISENDELLACVDRVRKATQGRGIWVVHRGGDRGVLFEGLLLRGERFLIRLTGNRHLIWNRQAVLAETLAQRCPRPYVERVVRQRPDGSEQVGELSFGARPVRLPGRRAALTLVVLKGFGEEPLMLLTNVQAGKGRKALWWLVEAYLTRWRIEDSLRFAKQSYALEDMRVLSYQRLRNLMALALLAMCLAMVHLGTRTNLAVPCHHAIRAEKRFFGMPDFRYYAIADGIREILAARRAPPFGFLAPARASPQLSLTGLDPP